MDPRKKPTDFGELDRAGKIQVSLRAALRLLLVLAAMFLLYYLIPVDGFNAANPTAAWIRLTAVVLAFLSVMALQARLVVSASVPQVRAVEAVVESVVAFLLLFALLYLSLSTTDPLSFSEPLDRADALYFTSSTFATVGFGDIVPLTQLARSLVAIQMFAGLGVLFMIAKVTFFAAKKGLSRGP
jgi:voltage-gated potassium channel